MEIPERADYALSARWRQQGAVHRGRICDVAGHADLRLRHWWRHCGRPGATAGLLPVAAWHRFMAASADWRPPAVLPAGVYLAQDGRLLSRCAGRQYVAARLPLAVGTTVTSGPGMESEP